jgi:sortase A
MNMFLHFLRGRAALGCVMLAVGTGVLAGPLAHGVTRQVSAAHAKVTWEKWKRSSATRPAGMSSDPAEPAFWLRVPSCKISTLVLQESNADALHRFPAVRPLEAGARVVFGHRDTHFHGLAEARFGDQISIETSDGYLTTYTVRAIHILLPEQVPAALEDPETSAALYLLTCYPFRYIGAAPKRFLVVATMNHEQAHSPSGEAR